MFTPADFKIRQSAQYPYISKTWQSWYSPMFGNKKQEDSGLSACVTLGLALNNTTLKNEVLFLSCVNGEISNSVDLTKHIKCLADDYLNKSMVQVASARSPETIIFECEKGKPNPFLNGLNFENIFRFYPDYFGGDELINRASLAHPFIKKVQFTNAPDSKDLRPDDNALISRCLSYPQNPESYALVSAFVQAILYAKQKGLFDQGQKGHHNGSPQTYGHYGS